MAALCAGAIWACDEDSRPPARIVTDLALQPSTDELQPASGGADHRIRADCPVALDDVSVSAMNTLEGVALAFTTTQRLLDQLRARVRKLTRSYDAHPEHIMWLQIGPNGQARSVPDSAGWMPQARARYEPVTDGAKIELVPVNPHDLDALRRRARRHERRMEDRQCWIPRAE